MFLCGRLGLSRRFIWRGGVCAEHSAAWGCVDLSALGRRGLGSLRSKFDSFGGRLVEFGVGAFAA